MGFGSVCKRLVVLVCAAVALTPATASAATLHVAPAGTDGAPCTVLAPCASFARAYRLAQPGDVVEAAAGSYGDQVIAGDRGAVTFRPALGAAVTVGDLDVSADGVAVRDLASSGAVSVKGTAENPTDGVRLTNVTAHTHYLVGTRDFVWEGGSLGPSHDEKISMLGGTPANVRATYDGVLWHDATRSSGAVHTECLLVAGVQGLTIRNSRFVNCAVFDVLISKIGDDPNPRDILIENTVFGASKDVGAASGFYTFMTGELPWDGFVLRNNVWEQQPVLQGTFTNARISNNIGPMDGACRPGIAYSHNVFTDSRCGATDKRHPDAMKDFMDRGAGDFRLRAGAVAIDSGDPLDAPAHDANGRARGGAPDAGPYEFADGSESGPGAASPTGGATRSPGESSAPGTLGGLVGAWGFEEASGVVAADASGAGNAGRISGARRVPGRHGRGLRFDGRGDVVTVRGSASLRLRRAMTLSAQVKPTGGRGWRAVMVKEHRRGVAYGLYAATRGGRPSAHVRVARDRALSAPGRLPRGRWTQLAMTWDGATVRLYRDAREVARARLSGSAAASDRSLRIGGNRLWGEWFKGVLDDVRVYDRALSARELAADARTPVGAATAPARAPRADGRALRRDGHAPRWLKR